MKLKQAGIAMTLLAGLLAGGVAVSQDCKWVELIGTDGKAIGHAWLKNTPTGVLVRVEAKGLPEGWHGFHLHETGACDAPAFTSAGGHYNPAGNQHGFEQTGGPHFGDLPNVYVPASGELHIEALAAHVTINQAAEGQQASPHGFHPLIDANGSALVIHAQADDYESQPSGDAGARIACGIIK